MPGFRGKGRYTDDELKALVDTSGALGWQMGLHAIGDAAIQQTVMAYDQGLETTQGMEHQGKDRRWFTDHFTIMPPADTMATMKRDNIMIAQQPNFEYTLEGRYMETMDDFRVTHNNSVVTPVKKYNLFMAFGSDDLPIGPMVGLYAAVTRKGLSGAVHGPEEAIPMREAIRMYTANGPYLSWDESKKGTLEVGKFADMIVLPEDILTLAPSKVLNMKVDMTFINGKLVYDRAKAN
jgi:predicted amidohydrolase YtcJ